MDMLQKWKSLSAFIHWNEMIWLWMRLGRRCDVVMESCELAQTTLTDGTQKTKKTHTQIAYKPSDAAILLPNNALTYHSYYILSLVTRIRPFLVILVSVFFLFLSRPSIKLDSIIWHDKYVVRVGDITRYWAWYSIELCSASMCALKCV